MKVSISYLIIGALTFSMIGQASAQMIDYGRMKRRQQAAQKAKQSRQKPVQAVKKVKVKEIPVVKVDLELPSVTNRSERVYDFNEDGKLQQAEIKKFYADVVVSVEQWGRFTINSDLLKNFDKNKDGRISRYEIREIKQRIN